MCIELRQGSEFDGQPGHSINGPAAQAQNGLVEGFGGIFLDREAFATVQLAGHADLPGPRVGSLVPGHSSISRGVTPLGGFAPELVHSLRAYGVKPRYLSGVCDSWQEAFPNFQ